jgi:hypothetical protein
MFVYLARGIETNPLLSLDVFQTFIVVVSSRRQNRLFGEEQPPPLLKEA